MKSEKWLYNGQEVDIPIIDDDDIDKIITNNLEDTLNFSINNDDLENTIEIVNKEGNLNE